MSKLVSVIIPVYNCGAYITESLNSICNQTYANLEIIVVYDRSEDDTLEKIEAVAATDNRIKLLRFDGLRSVAKSLNKGLGAATGEYIARMDGDDIAPDYRIERQVAYMEAHPDCVMCGGGFRYIVDGLIQPQEYYPAESTADIRFGMLFKTQFNHPTVMLKAELIKNNLLKYDETYRAEDYDLWSRIVYDYPVANMHEILLNYRLLSTGATSTYSQQLHVDKGRVQRSNFDRFGIEISGDTNMMIGAESMNQLQDWEQAVSQVLKSMISATGLDSVASGLPSYEIVRSNIYDLYNATSLRLRIPINNDRRFKQQFAEIIDAYGWNVSTSVKSYIKYLGKLIKYRIN